MSAKQKVNIHSSIADSHENSASIVAWVKNEAISTSGIHVNSCMDKPTERESCNRAWTAQYLSNDSVEQHALASATPFFPLFSPKHYQATDANSGKTMFHLFNNSTMEHHLPQCRMVVKSHGCSSGKLVDFEFITYGYALSAAHTINKFISPNHL